MCVHLNIAECLQDLYMVLKNRIAGLIVLYGVKLFLRQQIPSAQVYNVFYVHIYDGFNDIKDSLDKQRLCFFFLH